MRVNIKVSGVNKTMRKFEEYTGVVSRKTSEAVEKTALDIERRAKTKAPVDTGRLKNSIHTEPRGNTRDGLARMWNMLYSLSLERVK